MGGADQMMTTEVSTGMIVKEFRTHPVRLADDGFFNLTDMALAGGKGRTFASDWIESKQGREYIELAIMQSKSDFSDLVRRVHGGANDRGIWAHYKIARRFAQACCAELAWWVDETIEALAKSQPVETPEYHMMKWAEGVGLVVQDHTATLLGHSKELQRHDVEIGTLFELQTKRRLKAGPEAEIRDRWAEKLGGKTEVKCGRGRIDIYVPREWIVEVKDEDHWTQVVGQLANYSRHDRECRKMAVFFTRPGCTPWPRKRRYEIALRLNNQGIRAWWDGDETDYNTPYPARQRTLFQ